MAAAGERLLHRCIAQVETFPERVQAMRVEPGSRLAETDWWTEDIDPLSEQVKHLVVSAHEHLRFLVEYVPTMGGYTLARSAIESSALGLWLLHRGTLNARIMASLRLSWRNQQDTEAFADGSGLGNSEGRVTFETGFGRAAMHDRRFLDVSSTSFRAGARS